MRGCGLQGLLSPQVVQAPARRQARLRCGGQIQTERRLRRRAETPCVQSTRGAPGVVNSFWAESECPLSCDWRAACKRGTAGPRWTLWEGNADWWRVSLRATASSITDDRRFDAANHSRYDACLAEGLRPPTAVTKCQALTVTELALDSHIPMCSIVLPSYQVQMR